ncbi:uroporphyrinogen-III synthase [Flaviaesturariibacter flavus]|uniref:Uroporphyrinogen-III synthase n=1 Tax=Flaviaesturariibacter flavus TaxID=2502780 RepID=A0A4R1B968_9BACT|nr:uroporphyrinogen-III synthase [Flaviaesturariibacter flavus]TCJ13219.1 uroporphyrinogen-III synthase [Flaviaesturariibacter flavus]
MPKADRAILSTRPLPAALVLEAAARGFEVNCLSFIETEAIQDTALAQRIRFLATEAHTVVFTSMNAVEAVAAQVRTAPDWKVYCIGHSTRALVESELGLPVAGTANDAAALADVIIAAGETEVLFFCGDIRRDTLPVKLREAGIRINEQVVYRTIATPQRVGKDYRALLFFSPSAVESYFSVNQPAKHSVLFAIGTTTADAIRRHFSGTVVIARQPGKEDLLREAMEFFETFITKNNL